MNIIILVGFIAWMGSLQKCANGASRISFTVAVKNSANQGSTSFILCTAFGQKADRISQYYVKGSPIGIEAEVRNNQYQDKNENTQKTYNFIVRQVFFVGPKSANPAVAAASNPAIPTGAVPMTAAPSGGLPFPPAPPLTKTTAPPVAPAQPAAIPAQPVVPVEAPLPPAPAAAPPQGLKLGKLSDVFTADEMTFSTSAEAC